MIDRRPLLASALAFLAWLILWPVREARGSYRAGPRLASDTSIGDQTITSTTYVSMASVSVTPRRKQTVFIELQFGMNAGGATDNLDCNIVDEGATELALGRITGSTSFNTSGGNLIAKQDVEAGTAKTYTLQGKVVASGDSMSTAPGGLGAGRLIVWVVDS